MMLNTLFMVMNNEYLSHLVGLDAIFSVNENADTRKLHHSINHCGIAKEGVINFVYLVHQHTSLN